MSQVPLCAACFPKASSQPLLDRQCAKLPSLGYMPSPPGVPGLGKVPGAPGKACLLYLIFPFALPVLSQGFQAAWLLFQFECGAESLEASDLWFLPTSHVYLVRGPKHPTRNVNGHGGEPGSLEPSCRARKHFSECVSEPEWDPLPRKCFSFLWPPV